MAELVTKDKASSYGGVTGHDPSGGTNTMDLELLRVENKGAGGLSGR